MTAKLTASDAAPLDYFGHSVAVSDTDETVLVGAYQDDDESTKLRRFRFGVHIREACR